MTPLEQARHKLRRLQRLVGEYGSLDDRSTEIRETLYELKEALSKVKEDQ